MTGRFWFYKHRDRAHCVLTLSQSQYSCRRFQFYLISCGPKSFFDKQKIHFLKQDTENLWVHGSLHVDSSSVTVHWCNIWAPVLQSVYLKWGEFTSHDVLTAGAWRCVVGLTLLNTQTVLLHGDPLQTQSQQLLHDEPRLRHQCLDPTASACQRGWGALHAAQRKPQGDHRKITQTFHRKSHWAESSLETWTHQTQHE